MRARSIILCGLLPLVFSPTEHGSDGVQVRELVVRLGDKDPAVRELAALELGKLGPRAESAIPALAAALRYLGENDVPPKAAWALGQIGSAAVPSLIAAFTDHNEWVRDVVVDALATVGDPAVPLLVKHLASKDDYVCDAAAETLGKMGPSARDAVPALIEASRRRTPAEAAIAALGQIGPVTGGVVDVLVERLDDEDRHRRLAAAAAIGQIGEAAAVATSSLIRQLTEEDPALRAAAASALGKIGPGAKTAIPALRKALDDPNRYIRSVANDALKKVEGSH